MIADRGEQSKFQVPIWRPGCYKWTEIKSGKVHRTLIPESNPPKFTSILICPFLETHPTQRLGSSCFCVIVPWGVFMIFFSFWNIVYRYFAEWACPTKDGNQSKGSYTLFCHPIANFKLPVKPDLTFLDWRVFFFMFHSTHSFCLSFHRLNWANGFAFLLPNLMKSDKRCLFTGWTCHVGCKSSQLLLALACQWQKHTCLRAQNRAPLNVPVVAACTFWVRRPEVVFSLPLLLMVFNVLSSTHSSKLQLHDSSEKKNCFSWQSSFQGNDRP